VCITKETTLKGIRVLCLQINKCISANQRFDNFLTHHINVETVKGKQFDVTGHPPYNCQFNPTELIWKQLKNVVGKRNTIYQPQHVEKLIPELLESLRRLGRKLFCI
jgi:transposase